MKAIKEFRVNEFLSLRFEWNQTIIYVKGEPFKQCKSLLFHISIDKLNYFDGIESIDDAEMNYQRIYDETYQVRGIGKLPPKEEFWGHCSNLQVWHEHDYDTRLLHSSLAFPLLRRLAEVGDSKAKAIFFEEIVNRYKNGNEYTREYLGEEGYLNLLPIDMRFHAILEEEDFTALYDLWEELQNDEGVDDFTLEDLYFYELFEIKNRQIVKLTLSQVGLSKFPASILKMRHLKALDLSGNEIEQILRKIYRLKKLRRLLLYRNKIKYLPISICSMKNLEELRLDSNHIQCLPLHIGNLINLKKLSIDNNKLGKLSESICELENLEELYLRGNNIKYLPENISRLTNLRNLLLNRNALACLPDSLYKLRNLRILYLERNKFKKTPEVIKKMNFVERLDI